MHRDDGPEVTVVGGGPCGLAAALAAARQQRSVRLIEASSTLGGMAASPTVAGQRVDLGSHRLHPSASAPVQQLLDELLGEDLQLRRRDGRLHLRDRWIPFPFGPVQLARSLPPRFAAGALGDLALRPLRRPRHDSYAEVVRVGLGPTLLADFHGPMAAKLWGRDPDDLAGELARRRIPVSGPTAMARKLARATRPGGRTFRYPRRGYGQLGERLADAARDHGVQLCTDTRVTGVGTGARTVTVTTDGHDTFTTGRVLWTAPLDALASVIPGSPRERLDRLVHRGLVLVYLAVPQPRYHHTDAHYVPDADVAFSRLSEPKNYRDGPDPADRTVLCAEVPATAGDATWRAGNSELAALVTDGMARVGLPVPPVEEVAVIRLPRVYPVLTRAHADDRAAALGWADCLEGVTVVGRQGTFVADNVHHVLDAALTAASCLGPDGAWDADAWRRARARFETFVVDD